LWSNKRKQGKCAYETDNYVFHFFKFLDYWLNKLMDTKLQQSN
jgi:hypothetical protein